MKKDEEPVVGQYSISELKVVHALYTANITDWLFYKSAYNGDDTFISEVLFQHTREEDDAYAQRLKEAYSFGYASSIIHLLNFYLTDTPPLRAPNGLADREDFLAFIDNVDLYGTNFDVFINDAQKTSAIFGSVGILIDKPGGLFSIDDVTVFPYLAAYTLNNILDWKFVRNTSKNIYELDYIKLRDNNKDYLVWTTTKWQRYIMNDDESEIIGFEEGENPLGIVPFIWMPNIRDLDNPYLGVSDLKNVCKIVGEIVRAMSEVSQTIKYSAFPMLMMPSEIDGYETDHANSDNEIVVGKEAVLNFNPEYGAGGKPAWLDTNVEQNVSGVKDYCDYITEELFRGCLLSSVMQQRDKAQTKSGALLRIEQKQLSSLLSKKSNSMINCELEIMRIWCMWQDCEELAKTYEVSKTRSFSIDDLSTELDYTFSAVDKIPSDTFAKEVFKKVSNVLLPNIPIGTLHKLESEIESYDSDAIRLRDIAEANIGKTVAVETESESTTAE